MKKPENLGGPSTSRMNNLPSVIPTPTQVSEKEPPQSLKTRKEEEIRSQDQLREKILPGSKLIFREEATNYGRDKIFHTYGGTVQVTE